jgi:signal transduction histidine kinase
VSLAQIGFEEFYTEAQLKTYLTTARTETEKADGLGMLAVHYQSNKKDSLANESLKQLRKLVANSNDVKVKSRVLWWENYFEPDTALAGKYLDWAIRNHLKEEEIIGQVELARVLIHINQNLAEQHALLAWKTWNEWKADSIVKDSSKLQVLEQLAHVYVHKKDGRKAVNNILLLQDYASQDRNIPLKEIALNAVAGMYFEWRGQEKKATDWLLRLYNHYRRTGQQNKLLYATFGLASQYAHIGEKENAQKYFAESEQLREALGVYGSSLEYGNLAMFEAGLISPEDYASLIESDYNHHYAISPVKKASLKVNLYFRADKPDSLIYYLNKYRELAVNSNEFNENNYNYLMVQYFLKKKKYGESIPYLRKLESESLSENEIGGLQMVYSILAQAYAGLKNYDSAYQNLQRAYSLKDSLEKLSAKDEVSLMEMEKQEDLLAASFEEETKVQAAEQDRIRFKNRVRLYSLVAGLAVLLLLVFILWRNSKRKHLDKLKIQKAYDELKTTQQQLVQSEKMASLGELTAGVAHEIQNPLNFVNNFSELNTELISELEEEATKGNLEEVRSIVKDIKANEEKINHHGKRADAIVKGMLQHSRSSSATKEPVDLNALVDEYTRLTYHGIRAKDKTFNVRIDSSFDNTTGKIDMIPQDIGRVILNLLTNAFYAVGERKKSGGEHYDPVVTINTSRKNGIVEVSVTDNGNGIPAAVVNKIFQPFFTTKPTGKGTGLGLSLSYDIVKAHGGKLTVQTEEGKGSSFTISLPVKN